MSYSAINRTGEPVKADNKLGPAEQVPRTSVNVPHITIRVLGSATPTTITTPGLPVVITSGAATILSATDFSHDNAGLITYTGTDPVFVRIELWMQVAAANGAQVVGGRVFREGTSSVTEGFQIGAIAATARNFSTFGSSTLTTGATLQAAVANHTDTTDITVTDYILTVTAV